MQFRLLGPVEIDNAGQLLPLPRRRERCLLAVLLLHPNRVVSMDRLTELLWDGEPPDRARRIIHSHVSRLRTALAAHDGPAIESVADGYQVNVEPQAVDVHRFQTLLTQAAATADLAERINHLQAALELWRGRPLYNAATDWLRDRLCTRLAEQHRTATEDLYAANLDLRRERDILPELAEFATDHPGREGLVALHMRALYQAGRKADALEVYAHAHSYLADQLGLDPGPDLRELHQAILRDEFTTPTPPTPKSHSGPQATSPAPREPSIPRQLPADVSGFSGRSAELDQLDTLLEGSNPASAMVISAIGGTAGVGKTALAIHWGHRVRDRFPDGQLYINLRGYHPDQPADPSEVLARFLSALGFNGHDIPQDLDDRAARFRSELADRQMLIVLDNAGSVEQVRPLLPGSSASAVVVTSRDSLAGLVAVQGAHRVSLDLLTPAESLALLRRLIGSRCDAEPTAAGALADQCARLPLALRVAAELAIAHPTVPLATLAAELSDQQRRLDLLDGGDPYAAVRTVFSWSIQNLPSDAAATFRLLGLHPGPDIDPYAVAALADTNLDVARRRLELLARAGLVQPTSLGRYGMHDLLRTYAAQLAADEDTDQHRQEALGRLFEYYLAAAAAAMDSWYPAESQRRPKIPAPAISVPVLTSPEAAKTWLDTERSCLVAMAALAAAHGRPVYPRQLTGILHRYLEAGQYIDGMVAYHHAYQAAELAYDLAAQAEALRGLGALSVQMGRFGAAADHLAKALALYRRVGDETGAANALANLGVVEERMGRHQSAADHQRQALAGFRRAGDEIGEANALTNLGICEDLLGRYEQATDCHRQALNRYQKLGNPQGEVCALNNLGAVETKLSCYDAAAEHYWEALALARRLRHPHAEAAALDSLGILHIRLGQPVQASTYFEQALDLYRETSNRDGEAWARNGLGEAALLAGCPSDAFSHHTAALAVSTEIGIRDQQARAHAGLGDVHRALGELTPARTHYEQAIAGYRDLGMPEADEVYARLDAHAEG